VGSVSEDGRRLEPYASIPLLVTPLLREVFIEFAERSERLLRFFGFLCLFAGAGGLLYGLFDALGFGGRFVLERVLNAAGGAFLFQVFVWSVYLYNTFVQYRRRVDNAWANIDPDLKMRADLIPALVEVAKGYMKHERQLPEALSRLRAQSAREKKIAAESALAAGAARLLSVVEKYPELIADAAVGKIFRELQALEEKIAHGREFYNATVREYNDKVMAFPRGLVARLFGFRPERYFDEINAD
jgi:LemA protein